ncbi:MAG: hypothetical protein IKF78_01685 [Atopobiaceae bacterium]|nr:hypothetical protein [Atopobiaceae bacterium]
MRYEDTPDAQEYGCAAVICTAVEAESVSLRQIFGGGWSRIHVPGDTQRYYEATFVDKNGNGQLAITCQQDVMGMPAASVLATKATMLFRPRYLIMCGIAAGICKDADQMFGDVLVPSTAWDYSTGKVVGPDKSEIHFGSIGFLPRLHSLRLDPELKELMDELSKPDACEFHLQTDPLACGPSVMANEFAVDLHVRSLLPSTVGLGMESYGVFLAASNALEPRPKALAIKSVCDYADEEKND